MISARLVGMSCCYPTYIREPDSLHQITAVAAWPWQDIAVYLTLC